MSGQLSVAGLGIRHERDAGGDGRRTWYDAAGVQLG
jgi:hypothetical protein